MTGFVYHGSIRSGLKKLLPHHSSHGKNYLYATPSDLIALFFICNQIKNFKDLSLALGRSAISGAPYICERYKGAFEDSYRGVSGSLYFLSALSFQKKTSWPEEVVCSHAQRVKKEVPINDVYIHLIKARQESAIEIFTYPDRPNNIPSDDEDLVQKAVTMIINNGTIYWDVVKKYHLHICSRVSKVFDGQGLYGILPKYWKNLYAPHDVGAKVEAFIEDGLRFRREKQNGLFIPLSPR